METEVGFLMGFMAGVVFLALLIASDRRSLVNQARMWLTRLLIRAAMKTCVMGFCHDQLAEALRYEVDA
jgi:hypothetical protein